MKKFIIIIACSLLSYRVLAVNDQDKPDYTPTNTTETTNINSNTKPDVPDKAYSLRPNDIVVNISDFNIDEPIPFNHRNLFQPNLPFMHGGYYPMHSSVHIVHPIHASAQTIHPIQPIYPPANTFINDHKIVGIISAVGEQITKYKAGDMISINKLSRSNPLPTDHNNHTQTFFNYQVYPDASVYGDSEKVNVNTEEYPTNAKAKQNFGQ